METQRIADAARGLRHVFLRDMLLQASIGVHPPEHEATQRVRINVDLGVEDDGARPVSRTAVGRPVGSDELTRVVDYERIATTVRRIVAAGHVRLVETLAERIAERKERVGHVGAEDCNVFHLLIVVVVEESAASQLDLVDRGVLGEGGDHAAVEFLSRKRISCGKMRIGTRRMTLPMVRKRS